HRLDGEAAVTGQRLDLVEDVERHAGEGGLVLVARHQHGDLLHAGRREGVRHAEALAALLPLGAGPRLASDVVLGLGDARIGALAVPDVVRIDRVDRRTDGRRAVDADLGDGFAVPDDFDARRGRYVGVDRQNVVDRPLVRRDVGRVAL